MGEEVKKPEAEEKKMEEKKPEEEKKEQKEEAKEAEKPADEKKEETKTEEAKDGKESKEEAPPPPQEIVLKVFMHCEGCARKVRRSLKGFEGVEDVITDCRTQKVVVKGEKADPLKVLARVQRKSHRQVELLSPIPKPPAEEEKKPEEEKPKPEEKKEEPPIILAVLKVYMHCEACAQEIKKRIMRMKGVESAEPDLKSSEVSVRGVFDPANLVKYVYKRTGKHAVVVKQELEKKEKGEESKESKEEKKAEDGEDKDKKGGEGGGGGAGDGGESKDKKEAEADAKPADSDAPAVEETKLMEMKHEYLYPYYPSRVGYYSYPQPLQQPLPQQYFHAGFYNYAQVPHAPQMFSDENPNACSVM